MKLNMKTVSKIIDKYPTSKSSVLSVLQDIQEKYNWLPPDALRMISIKLGVPLIDIYSVATFYRAFSLTPRINPGCTTKDNQFTLETVNCLGACALAPIVVVDGQYHGQTTVQKVNPILKKYQKKKTKKSQKKK